MNRREALAALVSLPEIARISRAEVKPLDVLVVEVPGQPSTEDVANMTDILKRIWPNNHVLLLNNGMQIKVVAGSEVR